MKSKKVTVTKEKLVKDLTESYQGYVQMKLGNGEMPDKEQITALSCGFCAALISFGFSEADALDIIKLASDNMKNDASNGEVQSSGKKVKSRGKVRPVSKKRSR